MPLYEERRFLIWGKTAPQLSLKYFETVCTGAVLEDGSPIRLYPIPFRYLEGTQFKKYQWMTARIAKDTFDSRPESYRINCDTIQLGEFVPPDEMEWYARREIMFRDPNWQSDSMSAIVDRQAATKHSLAVVSPKEIISVDLRPRPEDEELSFDLKRDRIVARWKEQKEGFLFSDFLPAELKNLDFLRNRIHVRWRCADGNEHYMQIMDWEVLEQQRRIGDEKTLENVCRHLDLGTYALRFFLGNIKEHPTRFTIVGLWYPKRKTGLLF